VRVNAVAPGPVETEMLNRFTGNGEGKANFLESVPVKRAATPTEIADTIVFLAVRHPSLPGSRSSSMAAKLPHSRRLLFSGWGSRCGRRTAYRLPQASSLRCPSKFDGRTV
jgi:hypothetical protein